MPVPWWLGTNTCTVPPLLDRHGKFVFTITYMLDVIHLIVTVLSDRPSFEWECNVTGRPIWFRPLKLTFSTCFHVVVAQQWHGHDDVWGFGERTVGGARDGDWRRWLSSHIFTEVTRACEKAQLLYAGCVHFTVDWLFWNLYGSYIAPRPMLSWKKPGNFSLTIWDL